MDATTKQVKDAIRSKYAWPGGHPLYLVTSDGAALCINCGRGEWPRICRSMRHNQHDGWNVLGVDINWEDVDLHCDHCSKPIEYAYGGRS